MAAHSICWLHVCSALYCWTECAVPAVSISAVGNMQAGRVWAVPCELCVFLLRRSLLMSLCGRLVLWCDAT